MSMLLKFIRAQITKNGSALFKPRNNKPYSKVNRSDTPATVEDTSKLYEVKKPWSSYGFDTKNKYLDRHYMHGLMFCGITVGIVFSAFVIGYAPDPKLRNWAQREAYLQLRYREEHGLPLIDPNLIDPSKFQLPTEEEIGDMDIVI